MTNAPPSRNLANDGTLIGVLKLMQNKLLQGMDDMLPAKVIAYNRATNRAQVQPLIVMVNTLNEQIERAQIASVPVLQIGGGGFVMSFPLNPGDLGWIKANDRDISLFKKNYAQAAPNTQRKHSFSDAVFIPDSFMRDVVISEEDSANLVIQNTAGTVKVSWSGDKVKITAPTIEMVAEDEISLTAPEIIMTASTEVTIDTPLTTITGEIAGNTNPLYTQLSTFGGDITTTGTVTGQTDVIAGTISGKTHVHSGVQTGPGNTGAPV